MTVHLFFTQVTLEQLIRTVVMSQSLMDPILLIWDQAKNHSTTNFYKLLVYMYISFLMLEAQVKFRQNCGHIILKHMHIMP